MATEISKQRKMPGIVFDSMREVNFLQNFWEVSKFAHLFLRVLVR